MSQATLMPAMLLRVCRPVNCPWKSVGVFSVQLVSVPLASRVRLLIVPGLNQTLKP